VRISELLFQLEGLRDSMWDVDIRAHNHCRKCDPENVTVVLVPTYDADDQWVRLELRFDEDD
jgi:hypothetical protein